MLCHGCCLAKPETVADVEAENLSVVEVIRVQEKVESFAPRSGLGESSFLIDNRELRSAEPGIRFRKSKAFDDKADSLAEWDSIVRGTDRGDGWLKVGGLYLPTVIRGVTVVTPSQEAGAEDWNGKLLPAKFVVRLERDDERPVGLDLNSDHVNALEILHIRERGLIKVYNARAVSENKKVREGYFITGVNGKADNCKAMFEALQSSRSLRLDVS